MQKKRNWVAVSVEKRHVLDGPQADLACCGKTMSAHLKDRLEMSPIYWW